MNFIYWLLCILIGLIPAWLVYRNDRKKTLPVNWLPAVLRFFTCFITATLLLAPAFPTTRTEEEKPLLLWLQDNSTSMNTALGKDSVAYRDKAKALWKQWQHDYTLVPLAFGGDLNKDSLFHYKQRSTNIAGALQAATDQYRDRNIGALIVATDGILNEGLDPLYVPLGSAVPIYTIGLGDSTQPRDLSVTRIYANKSVALNSNFEIIADIKAEKLIHTNTELTIQHNGATIGRSAVTIDKDRFSTSLRFETKADQKGFQRYSVVLPQMDGEQNTTNNRMDFFVEVIDEEIKVLLIAAAPHPDVAAIREALESVPQYKVTVSNGSNLPLQLNVYNLVIAHQIPSITGILPALANIPVWYILGRQSNLNVFNQQQAMVKISGGGNTNEVLPDLNTSFNYFTLSAGIRDVMAQMPPLQAPYGNYSVTGDVQVLLRQKIGNVSTDYPLWIFQNGAVPQAILCGEGIWRWRLYECKNSGRHEVVDELIRQTVSLLSVKKDRRPFRVFMDKYIFSDNEPVNLYAELRNDNGELVNTPEVTISIADSSGKPLQYVMGKSGHNYYLNAGLLAPGSYSFKGKVVYNGKNLASEGSFVVTSVPLEQLRTYADYDMLFRLSSQTGGSFFTYATMQSLTDSLTKSTSIKPIIHFDKTYTELIDRKWLFFLILLIAAAEWLLRKYWNV